MLDNNKVTKEGDIVLMHETSYLVIKEAESNTLRLLNLSTCELNAGSAMGFYISGNILEEKIDLGTIFRDIIYGK